MTEEFNLSEKEWADCESISHHNKEGNKYYSEEDVKEFIKKLKERFFSFDNGEDKAIALNYYGVIMIIDKLAGDKLR